MQAILFLFGVWLMTVGGVETAGVDGPELFDRLKTLSGTWNGVSTRGWDGTLDIQTVASGSAVVSTATFEAHPGETMVTVYHLDQGRLILTHYCVAGNQPRLAATAWDAAHRTARFSFIDGTNLKSRDDGHMDSVVMRFIDDDRFTSQWTWYQKGQERWMEEIVWERTK